ncbi:glycoside hydrolase family 28 protein [uncultured Sunxiuqinia sp.]|uniref:glycoside hydrolase family 28 protein n=1 Tax=uncultured Sunxiuqinia sp. TaxID=1573825 RepID=UPI002AA87626|nr:glycoside hydrolase family 28 protein [uncultured Sunxiuqinia sp.]
MIANQAKYKLLLTLFTLTMGFSAIAQNSFNILDHGATNQGKQKITDIIEHTIELASKAGGGTIYFPAGEYLTGPIVLKSNITIHLDAGAILKFSDDFNDYLPMVQSRWEGIDVFNFAPLFYAFEAENIAITGRGKIDGQGKKWWDYHHWLYSQPKDFKSEWQHEFAKQNKEILYPDEPGMIERGFLRPPFIQPMYCKNVLIEGITITNSPFWTINPQFCDNVTVTNVTINNPDSPNTDGINPESCRNVHISDCHISVGDDCITIKSGKDRAGRKMNMPCENITITNCTMLNGHGAVVIGSEMSGGVKKVTISNCVFEGTDRGIRIKSTRGRGGVVEDIRVSNIIMKGIRKEAIKLNMFYSKTAAEPVSERTPSFRNIHFSNITGEAHQAGFLLGLDELKIKNITFNDIQLKGEKGFSIEDAENIEFHNVKVDTQDGPSVMATDSKNLIIDNVKTDTPKNGIPVIKLTDVQNSFIYNCFQTYSTDIFLQLDGEKTKAIYLKNNELVNVKNQVVKSTDVNLTITE